MRLCRKCQMNTAPGSKLRLWLIQALAERAVEIVKQEQEKQTNG